MASLPDFPLAAFSSGGTKANNAYGSYSGITKSISGTNASDVPNNGTGWGLVNVVGSNDPRVLNGSMEATQIQLDGVRYLANTLRLERVRRKQSDPGEYLIDTWFPENGKIIASKIQSIRAWVEVTGPAATQAYNGTGQNINSGDGSVPTGTSTPVYDGYGNVVGSTPGTTARPDPQVVTFPQAPTPSGAPFFSKNLGKITAANINALINELNAAGNVCTCNCNYCTCNCNYCTCNCNYACTCNCNYSDERLKVNVEYL